MVYLTKMFLGIGCLLAGPGLLATGLPPQPSGTVVTACGHTYTYDSNNVGVVNTSSNGTTTSTVYVDGKPVLTETCPSGGGDNSAGNGPGGPTPPRRTRPTPPKPPGRNTLEQYFPFLK